MRQIESFENNLKSFRIDSRLTESDQNSKQALKWSKQLKMM